MSTNAPIATSRQLKLFLTAPHSCSYLAGKEATTLFIDPSIEPDTTLYSSLTLSGFRRSGPNLYRPHCGSCDACKSLRVVTHAFTPSRNQRRTSKRNQDLSARIVPARFSAEHFALYTRYIAGRHQDGEMYPADQEQYRSFLTSSADYARMVEFRLNDELLAVAVIDHLLDGISAIYTFFAPEPEHQARSLGTYAILWQIEHARRLRLPYVYLGYWIEESAKMAYKSHFQPFEYFHGQRWHRQQSQ